MYSVLLNNSHHSIARKWAERCQNTSDNLCSGLLHKFSLTLIPRHWKNWRGAPGLCIAQAVLLHSLHNSLRYVTDSNTEKYSVKYMFSNTTQNCGFHVCGGNMQMEKFLRYNRHVLHAVCFILSVHSNLWAIIMCGQKIQWVSYVLSQQSWFRLTNHFDHYAFIKHERPYFPVANR